MLISKQVVVLDFEGFRHKKSGFIIKELSIQSKNFSDTILFLPPVNFTELSASEQKCHNWVIRFLHGIEWSSGTFPYTFLETYFVLLAVRFQFATFYAKGIEKCAKISELLNRPVQNLENLNCPKIEELTAGNTSLCEFHSVKVCHKKRLSRHCAKKKALAFLDWLEHRNEAVSSSDKFVSKFDHMQLHDN